jgi:aminoglycoside phosphotransferase (APT) family kinase protein
MLYPAKSQTIPLPPDDGLFGLGQLLDVALVRERLNALGAQVENGQVFYLRYKPGTNCIAAYQFERRNLETGKAEPAFFYGKCSTPEAFSVAHKKAQAHRWVPPPIGPSVVSFEEGATLFYAFPIDTGLPGLRLLESPNRLRRFLQQHLSDYSTAAWRLSKGGLTTEVVRYKPERRAVLCFSTRAIDRKSGEKEEVRLYWRVYRDTQAAEIFRRMHFLKSVLPESGEFTVPRPLGFDSEARVLLMSAIKGQPLLELLQRNEATSAVEHTGAALARLHTFWDKRLPLRGPEAYLREALETKGMLATISPELAGQAYRMFTRLQGTVPEGNKFPNLVHGDFYHGQVLVGREQIGFVDFDRSHSGSRLTDIGNFLAHLKLLKLENRLTEPDDLADRFLEAYAEVWKEKPQPRELRWWTALSLFLLAVGPFRRLEPNWPEMVQAILDAAEEEMC